ncbi:MAG: DUF1906 domain-containing protein, partial [Nocardioides sp.]|nr:DUF1906 domain-containing protein [Nocardioides sp.]
ARSQGRGQGAATVAAAKSLGIASGSTLYYDLESFNIANTNCRASALWFVSAFTTKVHSLGYKVGFYSSAGSGIKAMYNTKKSGRKDFHFPDQLWIADWNGAAGTSTAYIPDSAWSPHARVKQYEGGHDETYGRVTVNVDRDYLDVGRGSVAPTVKHCGGLNVNWTNYATIRPASGSYVPPPNQVRALKCMLRERGSFNGLMTSTYGSALRTAILRWEASHHLPASTSWDLRAWRTLWAANKHPLLKRGTAGESVRDLQRALNATGQRQKTRITGVLDWQTNVALVAYQKRLGRTQNGMATSTTWADLAAGR